MEIICSNLLKNIKIKKGFFKSQDINVLKGVDYQIKQGEISAIIGEENSGKTTLINILSGKDSSFGGEILVDGVKDISKLRNNSVVISDFFKYKFKEGESVYNNLFSYAKKKKIHEYDIEKKIVDLKNVLDFEKVINKKISSLDDVSKAKIVIALAMLDNPGVLYFDNALIKLDAITKNIILKDLKRINKEFKTTIIIASIDFTDVEKICKRVSVLKDGKIIVDDDFDAVKSKYFKDKIISITFNKSYNSFKGDFEVVESSEYFLKIKVDFSKCDFASIINQFDVNTIVDISINSVPFMSL